MSNLEIAKQQPWYARRMALLELLEASGHDVSDEAMERYAAALGVPVELVDADLAALPATLAMELRCPECGRPWITDDERTLKQRFVDFIEDLTWIFRD